MSLRITTLLFAGLLVAGCGTPSSPTRDVSTPTSPQNEASTTGSVPASWLAPTPAGTSTPCPAIGFEDAGSAGATFAAYTRCGFTVTATSGNWVVWTGYGHPAPFVGFVSSKGTTTSGTIRVTSAAGMFTFESVDIYSSTTPIPYSISGLANNATVFTIQATQPNTFGNFATVSNPNANVQVDTLLIELTNPAAPCCANPVGLDTLLVK